ncbi:hypothetical protein OGAPHI_000053 [Ogataea philodendri]|uniref:Importin N-terminal domain-containing protein n=1 Tax=Ogataea philodendri TaxID=1378263 RepID=A0A9P8PGY1_9ASCO|nr:uncharacterized protein OGAPHI_000053 [Ogataea philodendri]KAH3671867.1 hypothetical protein OGAPHI_000053 [Ogataea philodendri]
MDTQFLSGLEQTLRNILSPDNNAIKAATQALKNQYYTSPLALPSLIHLLQNSADDSTKQLAAVEANKLVPKQWEALDDSLKTQIKESLIHFAFGYKSKNIRHSTARIVAAIAELEIPDNKWPSLLETLVGGAQDANVQTREMAVFLIYCVFDTLPVEWFEHSESFLTLFATTLQDRESIETQVTTVSAIEVLSSYVEQDETLIAKLAPAFSSLFPSMIQLLKNSLSFTDTEKTTDLFTAFNGFILLDIRLLADNFVDIVNLMIETSLNKDCDEEIRACALRTLIQCISYRKSKISQAKLGGQMASCALKVASEEDEEAEEELENEDGENENEEATPHTLALRLLSELSVNLPSNQIIQPILEIAPQLLGSQNPFERRAALLAIGVTVEGAPDYISTQLPNIIQLVIAGMHDSSIVVKAAALRTLAQLNEELKDTVAEYHELLLSPIIAIIDSTNKIMVYKYATCALDTLIEYMSNESIKQYMEPLMNKLFQMLDTAQSSSLKSSIVSAIGSVAYAAGKAFTPYFDPSIKFLEKFIANMNDIEGMTEDDIELRAQTFENVSSMARAVGSESFAPYAQPLIDASYSAIHSTNGRLRESGFAFISNMAKVYGEQFTPFLDKIVPEIFTCLQQEEFDFNFESDDENADEADVAEKLNVHTGVTVEKEVALVALSSLAVGTKAGFTNYVEETMKILADQIEESYAVREASLSTMWKIAYCMFEAHGLNDKVLELIRTVRSITIGILPEEFDVHMVMTCIDSLYEYVKSKSMGKVAIMDGTDSSQLESLCTQLMLIIKNEHLCLSQPDDDVPDDEVDTTETEAVIYDSALEVLVSLADAFGADFVRIFSSFKDVVLAQVKSKVKNKRVSTVGCVAEICNGIKSSNPYTQELLEIFIDRLANDKSSEVRGSAAYGIGILIEYSTIDVSSAYATILNSLSKLLNKAGKEASKTDDDDVETKDTINRTIANACGCVSRMTLKHQDAVPLNVIIPSLLSHLPLETGLEENRPIFDLILKLYEENNEIILSATTQVVEIFEQVFTKELEKEKLINESTLGREENIERLNQFDCPETQSKVVAFLKYLESKFAGVVSSKEVLKNVIA